MHVEDFVAKRTKELIKQQHITMYKLAQLSGLKQSTISNIIKRKTLPNLITLEKICKGFEITLSQFFQENDIYLSLTDDQKQIVDLWITLSDDNKNIIKTILQGMVNTK